MNTQELFTKISELFETAKVNHEDTSKVAKGRARKALSEMKKIIAAYNKTSVAEVKVK
tara:strand:- start:1782 stop:1955 length:174 start_codon:yes stop_codon:yes gene_type:complete